MSPDPGRPGPARGFTVLVNPSSGGGTAAASVVPVARALRDAGAHVTVTYSPGPVACRTLAEEAVRRGDVVVAAGGDGMVASLAGTVADAGGVLGLLPCGRGNDFARQLGVLPPGADPGAVAATLLEADAQAVDLVDVVGPGDESSRTVVGSVYAGVDSLASELVDRSHRLPGPLQYPYAAVRALLEYTPTLYTVVVDGVRVEHEAYTVVVANSGYYGSGMHIAPAAAVDDGLLDVVVIRAASRLRLLRAMPRLYAGTHVDLDEVVVLRGRVVELSAATPVTAYGDGERLRPLPVTATVRPAALRVLA